MLISITLNYNHWQKLAKLLTIVKFVYLTPGWSSASSRSTALNIQDLELELVLPDNERSRKRCCWIRLLLHSVCTDSLNVQFEQSIAQWTVSKDCIEHQSVTQLERAVLFVLHDAVHLLCTFCEQWTIHSAVVRWVQKRLPHSIQSKPIQVSAQHCQDATL